MGSPAGRGVNVFRVVQNKNVGNDRNGKIGLFSNGSGVAFLFWNTWHNSLKNKMVNKKKAGLAKYSYYNMIHVCK